jgi:hypothetical protein
MLKDKKKKSKSRSGAGLGGVGTEVLNIVLALQPISQQHPWLLAVLSGVSGTCFIYSLWNISFLQSSSGFRAAASRGLMVVLVVTGLYLFTAKVLWPEYQPVPVVVTGVDFALVQDAPNPDPEEPLYAIRFWYEAGSGQRVFGPSHAASKRLVPKILTEEEEGEGIASTVERIPPLKMNVQLQGGEKPYTETYFRFHKKDRELFDKGERFLYFWFVMHYRDKNTPSGKVVRLQKCGYSTRALDHYKVCKGHNQLLVVDWTKQ